MSMSLIRQLRLLLLSVLVVAIAGGLIVNVVATRDVLQTQLRLKNADNAQVLAMALTQQRGDAQLRELALAAQFDTGFYRRIRFTPTDGSPAVVRGAEGTATQAPAWFVALLPIASEPGTAQVSDGWRALGAVEVESHVAFAFDELWRGAQRALAWLLVLGVVAWGLAAVAMRTIRRPLDATVEQARALSEGRYVLVALPRVPELARVAEAMNAMIRRVKLLFESQAAQNESLRQQAHCDRLTGLPHRGYFMGRLDAMLQGEDGAQGAALVLVRVADLGGLNLRLGRETVDRALLALSQVLQAYPQRGGGCIAGRLNGSDFALALPAVGLAAETAESIAAALGATMPAFGAGMAVHVGAVEVARGQMPGAAMAQADLALARAEARGAFAVVVNGPQDAARGDVRHGEHGWREQLLAALDGARARLVAFPVLDRGGRLVHLECPLRLQLEPGGIFEAAATWLPLAVRSRLTARIDVLAITRALQDVAGDGKPRAVNLAGASLVMPGFAAHVRALLQEQGAAARQLWLEVGETAAADHFDVAQDFGRMLRPFGVRFGLEHAGERLHRIERLYELGVDYVKLDAAVCVGISHSDAAQAFLRSTAGLLHALSVQVLAEGVADAGDVTTLWACGVDAVTGPWATARGA